MDWNYEIQSEIKLPVNLTVNIPIIGNVQVDLALNPSQVTATIKGGINFECGTDPVAAFSGGCWCAMKTLTRNEPKILVNFNSDF